MMEAKISRLEHPREALLTQIHEHPDLMRGEIFECERKCLRRSHTYATGTWAG